MIPLTESWGIYTFKSFPREKKSLLIICVWLKKKSKVRNLGSLAGLLETLKVNFHHLHQLQQWKGQIIRAENTCQVNLQWKQYCVNTIMHQVRDKKRPSLLSHAALHKMRWEVDSICMHCFYCTYSESFNIFASQSCKVQQDSSQIRKHVLTVNLCLDHVKHMCWKLWLTQMQNKGDAHIYTGTSLSHTSLQWSLTGRDQRIGRPRKLTELSPGLLQLLDLVLQEEHGHCERQQRQKLQLGRHHDSEQPHQIIQR